MGFFVALRLAAALRLTACCSVSLRAGDARRRRGGDNAQSSHRPLGQPTKKAKKQGKCGGRVVFKPAGTGVDEGSGGDDAQSDRAGCRPRRNVTDTEASTAWGERTASDLASLLMELGRAVRGLSFYREGDPACAELIDRAWLAWSGELLRAGPLALSVGKAGFRAHGIDESVPFTHLDDLAGAFTRHDLDQISISSSLSRDALQAFIELLGKNSDSLGRAGGLIDALNDRCNTGIVLNGAAATTASPAPEPMTQPAAVPASESSDSLGAALLAPSRRLVVVPPSAHVDEKASIDDRPLDAPATDAGGDRLRLRLIELDRCTDDAAYAFLGRRIVEWATELHDAGLVEEYHRAVLVLADHAVGDGGRSGLQARVAQRLCCELASAERLETLIERALASDTRVSVRATQVLLQLGQHAIPAVFDRIAAGPSADQSGQLAAAMVALGEASVSHLTQVIDEPDDERAILAIRLAAELQHPGLVRAIATALEGDRPTLRRDAARSLAYLGGDDAIHALVNALSSERDELPETAAHWLGALRDMRALQPLLAALERATRSADGGARAREMIRALGALGSERAVPRLVALLERRSLLRRKPLRQLQVCAVVALHQLTGREAGRAVDRARRHRDPAVRERAVKLMTDAAQRSASPDA